MLLIGKYKNTEKLKNFVEIAIDWGLLKYGS